MPDDGVSRVDTYIRQMVSFQIEIQITEPGVVWRFGARHDICQNIDTTRLWTNYILPEKHISQHITFWDKTA